jgi:hypothetical protein
MDQATFGRAQHRLYVNCSGDAFMGGHKQPFQS